MNPSDMPEATRQSYLEYYVEKVRRSRRPRRGTARLVCRYSQHVEPREYDVTVKLLHFHRGEHRP